jgi:hypothetical protein
VNSFKVALLVIALALGYDASANPVTPQEGANPVPARGAVETEIKRLEQMEAKAFLERDIPTLSRLWDAKVRREQPGQQDRGGCFSRKPARFAETTDVVHARGGTPHDSGKPGHIDG